MNLINFLGGINSGRSNAIDTQSTINFYMELTGEGSKTGVALIGTPGTKLFVDLNPLVITDWQDTYDDVDAQYQYQDTISSGETYQTI